MLELEIDFLKAFILTKRMNAFIFIPLFAGKDSTGEG